MREKVIRALIDVLQDELKQNKAIETRKTEQLILGEWCRSKQAYLAFGVPEHRLNRWAIERKVIAKKFDPQSPGSAVIYKTADIRKAIEEMPDV